MKIAILDLTTHPPKLGDKPRVADQIANWIRPAMPQADFWKVDIAEAGEPMPTPDQFDGLLLSGSEFGVYDDVPWMVPLRQLLRDTKAAGKPIYGICFGHQIMADVFGGKAEKVSDPIMGARRFEMEDESFDAMVWHQDQVTEVPPGATVLSRSGYCPVGALAYDFPAASVQFHPEYREEHLRELYDLFAGDEITHDQRAAALESFASHDVKPDLQADEAAAFFRAHALQRT